MSEPIRIAQVIGQMVFGGVSSVVMNYYRAIDKTKIQFDFIIDENSSCPQEEEIKSLGGRIYRIPSYSHPFKYAKALKRIFLENKYQIVHSHLSTMALFSLRVAKKCGIPIRICHSHSTAGKGEFIRNMMKYMLRPFSKKYATHLFACGELAARFQYGYKTFNRGKVVILNNAISTEQFKYDVTTRNNIRVKMNLAGKYVLGNIGRMTPQKNHKFLIKIVNELHKINVNFCLILIGEGPLENKLRKQVKKYGLEEYVRFVGVSNKPEEYYNAMDLFVLPSIYEGLPVVGIEAQINGVPCLFSRRITTELKINSNVRYMSLKQSPKEWALNISNNFNEKRGNVIVDKFDINIQAKKLEDLYMGYLKQ